MVLDAMKSQAETYARKFDGEPYLDQGGINGTLEGEKASKEEVYGAADSLMDFYDELLGQDTEDVREDFKEDILYDMSWSEILKPRMDRQTARIFAPGLAASGIIAAVEPSMFGEVATASAAFCQTSNARATVSNAEANYNPFSGKVGVSRGELPEKQAYDTLASELVHKYQHQFNSDTWEDARKVDGEPPLMQGFERAAKIKALENFAEEEFQDLDWRELHDKRAASTAVNGYAQALSETSGAAEEDMREIGLSEDKAIEAVENVNSEESRGYDVVAASLMAQENVSGPEIYREVFENGSNSVSGFATP